MNICHWKQNYYGKINMANNVDIAIEELRKVQSLIYDYSASPNDIFKATESVMEYMHKGSKEIQINYDTISRQLTERMNTGRDPKK